MLQKEVQHSWRWSASVQSRAIASPRFLLASVLMHVLLTTAQEDFQGQTSWHVTCAPILAKSPSNAESAWGTSRGRTIWQHTSELTLERSRLPVMYVDVALPAQTKGEGTWRSTSESKQRKLRRSKRCSEGRILTHPDSKCHLCHLCLCTCELGQTNQLKTVFELGFTQ